MNEFIRPIRNVAPPRGKRTHRGIFTEIAAIIEALAVGGEAKELQVIAPDRHRVQAYFLQYVNLYIGPLDWHLKTRQIGDDRLLVWKVAGPRPDGSKNLLDGNEV